MNGREDVWLHLDGGGRLRLSDVVEFSAETPHLGDTFRRLLVRTRSDRRAALEQHWATLEEAFSWVDDLLAGRLEDPP